MSGGRERRGQGGERGRRRVGGGRRERGERQEGELELEMGGGEGRGEKTEGGLEVERGEGEREEEGGAEVEERERKDSVGEDVREMRWIENSVPSTLELISWKKNLTRIWIDESLDSWEQIHRQRHRCRKADR